MDLVPHLAVSLQLACIVGVVGCDHATDAADSVGPFASGGPSASCRSAGSA